MIHQRRIYEIFEANKRAFHARFRDHAARIMRRYGFDIVGMGKPKGTSEPSSCTCSDGLMNARRATHGRRL